MKHSEFNFNIYNTNFYGQTWEASFTKAVVVLVHGMGEHSGRYNHVAKKLNDNDFTLVAFDHFGHGKTEGKRGHNPSFEAVLQSVTEVVNRCNSLYPNIPIFLFGHSMGGNAVLNYVLRKDHNIKGVVSTSPFLKLAFQPPKIKLAAGKLFQKILPSLTMGNELNVNDLSRIQEEVDKYVNDPLNHSKISPNYSIAFIETGAWAIKNAKKLKTPVAIFHGTEDRITSHIGSQNFANSSKNAVIFLYEGGYHELHQDLCQEEMLEDVVNWLNSQL